MQLRAGSCVCGEGGEHFSSDGIEVVFFGLVVGDNA